MLSALFDDCCFLRGPLSPNLGDLMLLEHLLPELVKLFRRQVFYHICRNDLVGRNILFYQSITARLLLLFVDLLLQLSPLPLVLPHNVVIIGRWRRCGNVAAAAASTGSIILLKFIVIV